MPCPYASSGKKIQLLLNPLIDLVVANRRNQKHFGTIQLTKGKKFASSSRYPLCGDEKSSIMLLKNRQQAKSTIDGVSEMVQYKQVSKPSGDVNYCEA